jgi:hypothetical protein
MELFSGIKLEYRRFDIRFLILVSLFISPSWKDDMNVYSFLPIHDVQNKKLRNYTFLTKAFIKRLRKKWWSLSDSNRPPPECKSGALPDELRPHIL